jgi:amino acid transporter
VKSNDAPAPVLGIFDATMITVGIVIGAGIFQTPALVAGSAGSPAVMLLAWFLGGALSLVGALTYAELASSWPSVGGDYTFLHRAYGRGISFLFAWARSTVICAGSIALLGFVLGDYLTRLFSLGAYSSALYAVIAILLLTLINLAGFRRAARLQNVLTLIQIGGVLLVAAAGFTLDAAPAASAAAMGTVADAGAFGLAMVFVLLSFGGWNEAAYVSAEVRGGPRAILRALMISIALITIVYLLFVGGVLYGLGFETLKSTPAVGVEVVERALGSTSGQLVGIIVAVAALTSMNATMIVGARSNYAVAQDWPVLSRMGGWQGVRSTPTGGFMVQAAIALALVAFGATQRNGFAAMVEFTAPVFWCFFLLNGVALFVLRRKEPHRPRPFRVPWYPVLPLLFVLTCAYLLYSSIVYAQSRHATYIALIVMLSGAVALLAVSRWTRKSG